MYLIQFVVAIICVFGFTFSYPQFRDPKFFGTGGGNGHTQNGIVGLKYPNGAGGQVSYLHSKGYGHDVGVDASVPIWSKNNGRRESTLNLGGGVSHHFGGPGGNRFTDKRIGLNFIHKF